MLQSLAETLALGLAILFPLSRVVGAASESVFSNGTLMLCGVCGMWMVLRTRVPGRRWALEVPWELGVGAALSVLMAAGFPLITTLLGWSEVWEQSALHPALTRALLALTGAGYLVARAGVRLWLLWDRARHRRMVLALTHAHLVVALAVMLLFVIAISIPVLSSGDLGFVIPERGGIVALIADRIFLTLMPLLSVATALTVLVLAVLLPPSALFSYLVARRTLRRVKTLTETATQMREGHYGARVPVSGEDEIAQLQDDFNAMAEDLERTLRDLETERDTVSRLLSERRELVASVSHELRTPVATVRAVIESALDGEQESVTPSLRRDLAVIEGEVLRLQGLIDDLFTLSQAEVGRLALDCRPADVVPVVRRMVEALAPLAWRAGRVQVTAETPDALPLARVDVSRLEQILANLVRNAIRHTSPGGIVAVMASGEEEIVRIEVRDTGEGIPPEAMPHIWEQFYRGEAARAEESRGAGLGLALVKELTEAMAGTVSVESVVGEGSCFAVSLPRA